MRNFLFLLAFPSGKVEDVFLVATKAMAIFAIISEAKWANRFAQVIRGRVREIQFFAKSTTIFTIFHFTKLINKRTIEKALPFRKIGILRAANTSCRGILFTKFYWWGACAYIRQRIIFFTGDAFVAVNEETTFQWSAFFLIRKITFFAFGTVLILTVIWQSFTFSIFLQRIMLLTWQAAICWKLPTIGIRTHWNTESFR